MEMLRSFATLLLESTYGSQLQDEFKSDGSRFKGLDCCESLRLDSTALQWNFLMHSVSNAF